MAADAFTNADAPLCIGILGDDPFGPSLDETLKGETVHNHRLLVVRAKHVEDLKIASWCSSAGRKKAM